MAFKLRRYQEIKAVRINLINMWTITKELHLIFSLFSFVTIIIMSSVAKADVAVIKVNAAKEAGAVPEVFSSSIWIQNLENQRGDSYVIDKFFRDNQPATVQLSIPILVTTNNLGDYKSKLEDYFSTPAGVSFIKKAKEYNSLVIIGFDPCPMPKWLSSNPGVLAKISGWGGTVESCSPPKDYDLWGEVVKHTLNYLRSLGLKKLGIYTGSEQERDWAGDEESFFEYYANTARAAKSVDKEIKVGGPGPSWVIAKRSDCSSYESSVRSMCAKNNEWSNPNKEPLVKNFIAYVSKNHIPIDFINWHAFNVSIYGFKEDADLVTSWLKEYGLKNVALYPADWTYWTFPPYPDDMLDQHEISAYIPAAIYYMWKSGITWHGHDFDERDYGMRETPVKKARNYSTFIGDWSIFTWGGIIGGGIIKPAYNTFKAVNILFSEHKDNSRKLLETVFDETKTVVAFATRSDKGKEVGIIATNFIPQDKRRFPKYVLGKLKTLLNLSKEEIDSLKKCARKDEDNYTSDSIIKCTDILSSPEHKERSKQIIKNIISARKNPQEVQIHFTDIPYKGRVKLTTYTVDGSHSNACSYNKKTEPDKTDTPCGIGGKVDKAVWEAKQISKQKGLKEAEAYLLSSGYKRSELQSIKKILEKCHSENVKGMKGCMNELVDKMSYKSNHSAEKTRKDFKEAVNKYISTSHSFYYDYIDGINNWKDVSLEGSAKSELINITDDNYDLTLNMEPNAVWVVTLTPDVSGAN